METNPHRWIAALRASQQTLTSLVQPLASDQQTGPSYHSWRIADVMSHLGSQAELFEAWLHAGITHTDPPPMEHMQRVWDAWNGRSAKQQVDDSLAYNDRLVKRLESLTEEQLAGFRLPLFGMDLGAVDFMALRLAEHALHVWDIAVALEPAALVQAQAVDLIVDRLDSVAERGGKPEGTPARLHVRTTDPKRDFLLDIGETVKLTEWHDQSIDGDLRLPAEALVRLVYGRLDPQHTPPLAIAGPLSLDDLRRIFPGF